MSNDKLLAEYAQFVFDRGVSFAKMQSEVHKIADDLALWSCGGCAHEMRPCRHAKELSDRLYEAVSHP